MLLHLVNSMISHKTEVALRIAGGLSLLIGAALFGFFSRSLWSIALMGVVFTVSYIAGKWPLWIAMHQEQGITHTLVKLPPTFLVQIIMVGVLYIIGYGLGALLGTADGTTPLSGQDFIAVGCLLVFSLVTVLFIPKNRG